ncbi:unnamed protein product [Pylaiella littoralis]
MTHCISPPHVPFGINAGFDPAAEAVMGGITAQDFLDNPELKVYIEDAVRLVLAARPEKPLELIDEYLQSVLSQDNVVGREFAYINATTRNRRAFVRAVHEVFVDPSNGVAGGSNGGALVAEGHGFEQVDVVHLFGLICPDFPEDIIARVARILSQGSRHVRRRHSLDTRHQSSLGKQTSSHPTPAAAAAAETTSTPTSMTAGTVSDPSATVGMISAGSSNGAPLADAAASSPEAAQKAEDVKLLPFEVFLHACNIYFCFQEFFEDVRELFGSLAFRIDGGEGRTNNAGAGRGDNAYAQAAREVNLRTLLDQLQVMKAEPRNHLRYMDVRSTEAAVRRGGLGERVTLPAFVACLLLHSDGVTTSLLERTPVDGFAGRLEASLALWSDGRTSPQSSSGGGAYAAAETLGRRKKGSRKGSAAGRGAP